MCEPCAHTKDAEHLISAVLKSAVHTFVLSFFAAVNDSRVDSAEPEGTLIFTWKMVFLFPPTLTQTGGQFPSRGSVSQ